MVRLLPDSNIDALATQAEAPFLLFLLFTTSTSSAVSPPVLTAAGFREAANLLKDSSPHPTLLARANLGQHPQLVAQMGASPARPSLHVLPSMALHGRVGSPFADVDLPVNATPADLAELMTELVRQTALPVDGAGAATASSAAPDPPAAILPAAPLATDVDSSGTDDQRASGDAMASAMLRYPLLPLSSMADLITAGSNGHTLLVLLHAPWCRQCHVVERQMRWAAAQLALRFRSVKVCLADVSTAGGAELSSGVAASSGVMRRLPSLLIVTGATVWEYRGRTNAAALVAHMSRWATGQEPSTRGGEYRRVRKLYPAHLRGGRALSEPAGSYVSALCASNLTNALGDGHPGRPYAPLALLLLYGAESSTDWAASARQLHRAFRAAATMLHTRGVHARLYKAFVASGLRAEEPRVSEGQDGLGGGEEGSRGEEDGTGEASSKGEAAGEGGEGGARMVVNEPEKFGLDNLTWHAGLRAILQPSEDSQRLIIAAQQSLPRILLLRHGRYQIWSSAVHAFDFVDVLSQLAPQTSPSNNLTLTLTARNFSRVAKPMPLLLAVFTTRWCARCVEILQQLHRAALLLRALKPALPVALATIDMSDPDAAAWSLEEKPFGPGVASFPVGLLYSYGQPHGTYLKGPNANEIAQEMMRLADDLQRVHKAQVAERAAERRADQRSSEYGRDHRGRVDQE